MTEMLQKSLPYDGLVQKTLPGIAPMGAGEWLHVDGAYAAQMIRRIELLVQQRDRVLQLNATAFEAAQELLDKVITEVTAHHVTKKMTASPVPTAAMCP